MVIKHIKADLVPTFFFSFYYIQTRTLDFFGQHQNEFKHLCKWPASPSWTCLTLMCIFWSDPTNLHLHFPRLPLVRVSRDTALPVLRYARPVLRSDMFALPVPSLWTTVPLGHTHVSPRLFLLVLAPPPCVNCSIPSLHPMTLQPLFSFILLY